MTKKERIETLKARIKGDREAAVKAMLVIFERQTEDEKRAEVTSHSNGVGFGGADAEILTSFAKQYLQRGTLSEKQTALVLKKMSKYAGQIIKLGDEAKLDAEPIIERTVTHGQDCHKCNGSGRFRSAFGKDVGPCFACTGSGKKSFTEAQFSGWALPAGETLPDSDGAPMDLDTFLTTYGSTLMEEQS